MLVTRTRDTGKLARRSSLVDLTRAKLNEGLLQIGRTVDRATGIGTATEAAMIKGITRTMATTKATQTIDIRSNTTSTIRSTQINTMVRTTKLHLHVDLCLRRTFHQLSQDLRHLDPVILCLYAIMETGRVLTPIENYHLRSMVALVIVHRRSDLVWWPVTLNLRLHHSRCRSHRRNSERNLAYSRNLWPNNLP